MTLPELDPWQYTLSLAPQPDGIDVGGAWLRVGADMEVVALRCAAGREVGYVLGFPLDLTAGAYLSETHQLPFAAEGDVDDFAEKVLLHLGGRYVWISSYSGSVRVYTDCAGQVPCVFDPEMQLVASTAHAMFDDATYAARRDVALFDKLDVKRQGWFPGGLTGHKGVARVLPNHHLDLGTWTVARHWPRKPIGVAPDPQANVKEIIERVRVQHEALRATDRPIVQALTAGRETRMLLACARPFAPDLELMTVVAGDRHATDSIMARRIAAGEGLSHMEVPRVQASAAARDLFIRRGGHCLTDSNADFHPSVAPLAGKYHFVGGQGGETGRGFFWRAGDTDDMELTAEGLQARFGMASDPAVIEALEAWLGSLKGFGALEILDLAYIEQRLGPWFGVQFCSDPTLVRFAPLCTYRISELMIGLPADWKRNEGMCEAVIKETWPELLRYPFNSLGKLRDTLIKLSRAVSDPGLVIRKIRQRFG